MDLMFDPPTKKEKLILSRGIGYLFEDTRVAIYLRKDWMIPSPQEFIYSTNPKSDIQESFSFVTCLPNCREDNGVISVGNSLKLIPSTLAYETKTKLFKSYNLIKDRLSIVPELTLVWEGKFNGPSLS